MWSEGFKYIYKCDLKSTREVLTKLKREWEHEELVRNLMTDDDG